MKTIKESRHLATTEEHFLPAVFVDMGGLLVGVIVGKASDELVHKMNNKMEFQPTFFQNISYKSIAKSLETKQLLLNSIEEI